MSKWCTEHKLTEETRNQLKAKGFKQKEELESIDPADIHMLELNMAQSSLLKDILRKKQRPDTCKISNQIMNQKKYDASVHCVCNDDLKNIDKMSIKNWMITPRF